MSFVLLLGKLRGSNLSLEMAKLTKETGPPSFNGWPLRAVKAVIASSTDANAMKAASSPSSRRGQLVSTDDSYQSLYTHSEILVGFRFR